MGAIALGASLEISIPQTQVSASSFGCAKLTGASFRPQERGRAVLVHRSGQRAGCERQFQRCVVVGIDADQRTPLAHGRRDVIGRVVPADLLERETRPNRAAPPAIGVRGERARTARIALIQKRLSTLYALQLEEGDAGGDRDLP